MGWIYLILAIGSEVIGTLNLKVSDGFTLVCRRNRLDCAGRNLFVQGVGQCAQVGVVSLDNCRGGGVEYEQWWAWLMVLLYDKLP